jgi:hypothetical protein
MRGSPLDFPSPRGAEQRNFLTDFPSPRGAGRGWREAPGEGLTP